MSRSRALWPGPGVATCRLAAIRQPDAHTIGPACGVSRLAAIRQLPPFPPPRPAVRPCRVHGRKSRRGRGGPASRRGRRSRLAAGMSATSARRAKLAKNHAACFLAEDVVSYHGPRQPVSRTPRSGRGRPSRPRVPRSPVSRSRTEVAAVSTAGLPSRERTLGRDLAGAAIPAPASRRSPVSRSRALWPVASASRCGRWAACTRGGRSMDSRDTTGARHCGIRLGAGAAAGGEIAGRRLRHSHRR